jgi:hypothetical protein
MLRAFKVLLVASFVVLGTVATAAAQAPPEGVVLPCAERVDIARHLERRFAEVPVAIGLQADGRLLEVFASPAGSWTIVISTARGVSCVVSSGQGWLMLPSTVDDPMA